MNFALEARGIKKYFGPVKANDDLDLRLQRATVHAVVGENGAGKSTLMKILYGIYQPDSGEIFVNGEPVTIGSPDVAHRLGIGMVHQHFTLVGPLSVTENVILGVEPCTRGLIDYKFAEQQVREVSNRYNLTLEPTDIVESLPVGLQQRVEIIKVLFREARIIILDEPTAALTPAETSDLFRIIRDLVADGRSVVFITHKLNEVMEIADDITVIRDGRSVGSLTKDAATEKELARLMVGRDVMFSINKPEVTAGEIVLNVDNLTSESVSGDQRIENVSFSIRAGEIFGVVGVAGNGQDALEEAVTGLRRVTQGRIELMGKDITGLSTAQIRAMGVAHIPANRTATGLVMDFPLTDNGLLGHQYRSIFRNGPFINRKAVTDWINKLIEDFNIKTLSPNAPAFTLSGGNQQKLILAREMVHEPRLLLAVQPTRGVDIASIEMIHKALIEARSRGVAILLISNELDEILSLSDRIAVVYSGRIAGIGDPASFTIEEIGLMMAGAGKEVV